MAICEVATTPLLQYNSRANKYRHKYKDESLRCNGMKWQLHVAFLVKVKKFNMEQTQPVGWLPSLLFVAGRC